MNKVTEFNPTKAEIVTAIDKVKNLSIKGVVDTPGYEAVRSGKKILADYRIKITKYGKEQRAEALAWSREVLRQERELLDIIAPVEDDLKGKLVAIDDIKIKEERIVLLPNRKHLLEELKEFVPVISDEEILGMDEKEFATYYTEKQLECGNKRREKAEENKRQAMHDKEVKDAKENAVKEEQKIHAEQEAAEKKAEADRIEKQRIKEEAEKKRLGKNKVYKKWLADHGITDKTPKSEFFVTREGDGFSLYKFVSKIKI